MAEITLRQAAQWCGGRVEEKYADITFLGANNDSRKIQPGQLFLALQGERDGHDFIPMAMEKGAEGVPATPPSPVSRRDECILSPTSFIASITSSGSI